MLNVTNHQKCRSKPQYHLTPVRMAIIKKQTTSVGEDVEKLEPLHTVGGNAKWCSCCGKQNSGSSKRLKIELPYHPAIPLLGIYPKELTSVC